MSLITCPECRHQVSNHATTCPHCGYPIGKMPKKRVACENRSLSSEDDAITGLAADVSSPQKVKLSLWPFVPIALAVVAVIWLVAWSWASEIEKSKGRAAAIARPGEAFVGMFAGFREQMNALHAFPIALAGLVTAFIMWYKRAEPRWMVWIGLAANLIAIPLMLWIWSLTI